MYGSAVRPPDEGDAVRMLLAIAPTIVLVVYGQLMTKWRIAQLFSDLAAATDRMDRLLLYVKDPFILSSYAAALAGSAAWMFVLERHAVSMAFPVYVGLTVVAVALGGVLMFGEALSLTKIVAIVLILTGVAIGSQA